jgi:hypothetical protein
VLLLTALLVRMEVDNGSAFRGSVTCELLGTMAVLPCLKRTDGLDDKEAALEAGAVIGEVDACWPDASSVDQVDFLLARWMLCR